MSKEKKQKNKDDKITLTTVAFMLRSVWKAKPSLFIMMLLKYIPKALQSLLSIVLTKYIVDELVLAVGGVNVKEHIALAVTYALIILGSSLLVELINHVTYQTIEYSKLYLEEYFALLLSDKCMEMDFQHTENPEVLEQLQKANSGMNWSGNAGVGMIEQFISIFSNLITFLGVIIIVATSAPWLILIQIASLALIAIFKIKSRKIRFEAYKSSEKSTRIYNYYLWALSDYKLGKDIRLYDSAEAMKEKMDTHLERTIKIDEDREGRILKNELGIVSAGSVRDIAGYFYIGFLGIKRLIGLGDVSMLISSTSSFFNSVNSIIESLFWIAEEGDYSYQFVKFLEYPPAMEKGDRKLQRKNGHTIEFKNVSFKYPGSEKYVLKDVNITIKEGEHLSVVGLNGAGKSTFIKLLCRLYDVNEGEILLDGVNIKEYSTDEYRKIFSVVFQDFKLFAFSLKDNIVLAEDADNEKLIKTLEMSGFSEDVEALSQKENTMIGKDFDKGGTDLSGGQSQKIALSRAVYRSSPVVILDEPTAALDPLAEYEIYKKFDSLVGGKTAIYISHRLSSCKFCDRIAVFSDNTIKELGTHKELITIENGIYAEMFNTQAKYYIDAK